MSAAETPNQEHVKKALPMHVKWLKQNCLPDMEKPKDVFRLVRAKKSMKEQDLVVAESLKTLIELCYSFKKGELQAARNVVAELLTIASKAAPILADLESSAVRSRAAKKKPVFSDIRGITLDSQVILERVYEMNECLQAMGGKKVISKQSEWKTHVSTTRKKLVTLGLSPQEAHDLFDIETARSRSTNISKLKQLEKEIFNSQDSILPETMKISQKSRK